MSIYQTMKDCQDYTFVVGTKIEHERLKKSVHILHKKLSITIRKTKKFLFLIILPKSKFSRYELR